MPRQFLILSLPRSRSAWLAGWLGIASGLAVTHDYILDCCSVFDFASTYMRKELQGSCETGVSIYWKTIRKLLPAVQIITLHRPIHEIAASFDRLGFDVDEGMLEAQADALRELGKQPNVESVEFADLSDPVCAKWLFELCFPEHEWSS